MSLESTDGVEASSAMAANPGAMMAPARPTSSPPANAGAIRYGNSGLLEAPVSITAAAVPTASAMRSSRPSAPLG